MLNLNPGLKEITHSITGGALVAQGQLTRASSLFAWFADRCRQNRLLDAVLLCSCYLCYLLCTHIRCSHTHLRPHISLPMHPHVSSIIWYHGYRTQHYCFCNC